MKMSSKSLSDIAYEVLKESEQEIIFNELWSKVCEEGGFAGDFLKKKVAAFYNALMLDSRFISLEGNMWGLRERHAGDSLNIDPELLESYDDYEEFDDFEE